jgi:DNA-binding NarL/FixJ family response regulator
MGIKAIIIDASDDYRSLIAHHLTTHWSSAKVTEYDPREAGRLPQGFAGAGNDLVILGDPLGEERALDWLKQFNSIKEFPPVIVLGDGDERAIVEAMRAGAADYISYGKLNHSDFIQLCEAALESQQRASSRNNASKSGTFDGALLKNYTIEKKIAGGEIASVYLSSDAKNGRQVVLKVLQQVPDAGKSSVAFDRFVREFELIRDIRHPNVVRIYDFGVSDDNAYIAMEYCSRGSLKKRILSGMYADRAEEIMRQIAQALDAIHSVGILHRDLKPTNVLFREDDSVALIDFGLARQTHLKAEISGVGEIFGTPYYMSPEQGHGEAVDERSDIYSLGVMFFEMLTGKRPYEGDNALGVIMKHAREPIPRLPEHMKRYQPAIDRMMAKQPGQRFQSVDELLQWHPEPA